MQELSPETIRLLQSFESIDDAMVEVLRQKSEAERIMIGARLWKSARAIIAGAIRTENPDWTDDQVYHEVAKTISGGLVQ